MATSELILELDDQQVRISSPEKVYFPSLHLNKADVVGYFRSVGPGILRALHHRPTAMERWPGGVPGPDDEPQEAFYQKRLPGNAPDWVARVEVRFPSGRTAVEVAPDNLATVLWMANLGTLRFHPWPVRSAAPELVDQLRLDLDPQPGTGFRQAAEAAVELREVLTEAGLTAFCKTSGGRGVHVFVRIEPSDFITARHAVIAAGRELARRRPELVTVNWWKEERGERIFLDFNQMARDRLMTSAYSIRPVPDALVSAPLTWDELTEAEPQDFSVVTMPERFAERGDLWAELDTVAPGSLATLIEWYDRDAADGEGELPYPPEYPKMPGEPPRVQPSRKNQANWEDPN
ncbi:DNA ligase D-like protein (predicted polymerase) [Propionicimonas paludicola]|uniref:DNA ligase D-like protein (Predicted polymerase) n=1 Tax=Propionicimonas paludicola TaxID=185243 RepID=A0A2A9CSS0_9ACTN|nr:ATP-dependent DNA ligase [Propionicimonas paludicola]PFG16619.1 DNA ligase D-like protein (predicted polymerase) [Propionicimonas paludicola]